MECVSLKKPNATHEIRNRPTVYLLAFFSFWAKQSACGWLRLQNERGSPSLFLSLA